MVLGAGWGGHWSAGRPAAAAPTHLRLVLAALRLAVLCQAGGHGGGVEGARAGGAAQQVVHVARVHIRQVAVAQAVHVSIALRGGWAAGQWVSGQLRREASHALRSVTRPPVAWEPATSAARPCPSSAHRQAGARHVQVELGAQRHQAALARALEQPGDGDDVAVRPLVRLGLFVLLSWWGGL